jgi:hypothetical protein
MKTTLLRIPARRSSPYPVIELPVHRDPSATMVF